MPKITSVQDYFLSMRANEKECRTKEKGSFFSAPSYAVEGENANVWAFLFLNFMGTAAKKND